MEGTSIRKELDEALTCSLEATTIRAEVRRSFITTTVRDESHVTPQGRVRTGDQRLPVLCHCQLGQDIPITRVCLAQCCDPPDTLALLIINKGRLSASGIAERPPERPPFPGWCDHDAPRPYRRTVDLKQIPGRHPSLRAAACGSADCGLNCTLPHLPYQATRRLARASSCSAARSVR